MQASLILQRALVAALTVDPAISAMGLGFYDGPPADSRAPYLSIGTDVVTARGWQSGGGHEHRFALVLWDVRDGFAPVKEMLAEVERVVLAMPRVSGGLRLVWLRLLRGTVRRAQRNWIQGILEFQALSVMENRNGS